MIPMRNSQFRILEKGEGELIGWRDPDEQRHWIQENKSRALLDKRMNMSQAISKFVKDESVLAMGGLGHTRVSMTGIYEIIRQGITDLTFVSKCGMHELDVLIGAGTISNVETSYSFGHALRGLSPAGRRAVESGQVKVVAETSNAGHQWRFLGGMMGVPFIPARNLLGTDTFRKSSAIVIEDPFTKKPICLIPSCNPDVVVIHVPRCDKYGNCQIDGPLIEDFELARCARRLIITTEEIISNEQIRNEPWKTVIPFFLVDAVVEVQFGAHPVLMPYLYYFDENHIGEWLDLARTESGTQKYLEKYVYNVSDFQEYLELVGGAEKMNYLYEVEHYQQELAAPWLVAKQRASTPSDRPYSLTHLMICIAAKFLEDNSSVFVGTGLPMMAALFAQHAHAPNLLMVFEAGAVGPQMRALPISISDSRTFYRAVATSSMHDIMSLSQLGWIDYGFLGAAQIDKFGNVNTTIIGDHWEQPTVRLPGSGGANDVGSFCRKIIVIMRQDKRRFVEKLDFLTTAGYLSGVGQRDAVGLSKNSAPFKVITQLGAYGFDDATKQMKLEAIHPGVSIQTIKENSSFELLIPAEIRVTTPPTDTELDLLRKLDPTGMAIGK